LAGGQKHVRRSKVWSPDTKNWFGRWSKQGSHLNQLRRQLCLQREGVDVEGLADLHTPPTHTHVDHRRVWSDLEVENRRSTRKNILPARLAMRYGSTS
jgi:hypothetical protein